MLRTLYTARVGGARRQLPGTGKSTVLLAVRQSTQRAAAAAEADAIARAARVPGAKKPLAGPRTLPTKRVGLYDPALEKDSCGVGLAVQMKSIASRQVCYVLLRTSSIHVKSLTGTELPYRSVCVCLVV